MPIIRPEQEAIKNILMYVPRRTGARNPRRGGGGGGGFTPPAGITAWYDVQDASTLTLNGNTMESIADKSGNGFDMIGYNAFGGGDGGYYDDSSAFSGFKSIRYVMSAGQPGYANFAYTPNPIASSASARSTFMVVAPYYLGTNGGVVSLKGATGSTISADRVFSPLAANQLGEVYGKLRKYRVNSTNSYTALPGFPVIYCVREDLVAGQNAEVYSSDGTVTLTTLSDNDNLSYNYMVWGRTSSTQQISNGEVLEVLHYNEYLGDDDFNTVVSYLRGKYGF